MDENVKLSVQEALEGEGIWSAVDQTGSMFLQLPYMFAHVVLNDASKYEQALKALRELQLRLKSKGQQFERRLRSRWRIEQVEHKGAYYDESGNLHAAADLHVTLSSGTRVQGVRVAFTSQTGDDLKRMTGTSDRDYETQRRQKVDTTRSFIRLLLAACGDFAWDPLWNDHLTIDSATLAWIRQEEKSR